MSFFSLFKTNTKNTKRNLFIHIPKTGGSTFVGLLKASLNNKSNIATHLIEQVGVTAIKHVDFSTKNRLFKSPEIFNESKLNYYKQNYNLFMLVRNPIERLLSEFNFQYHILNGKNGNKNAAIINQLKPFPNTFEKYISFKQTQNYQIKFLLGRKLADIKPVTQNEFQKINLGINNLPIHCGVTDKYQNFLHKFQKITTIKLNKKVVVRKKTPYIYHHEISEKLKTKIIALNKYDYQLYKSIKNNININNSKKFKFEKNDQFIV